MSHSSCSSTGGETFSPGESLVLKFLLRDSDIKSVVSSVMIQDKGLKDASTINSKNRKLFVSAMGRIVRSHYGLPRKD